ncbi:MAG TPA: hypothetical protein EYP36_05440 [Calditrichaeota bacterium]|nr:hypothetical protein [Calditrichota bacterium]
MFCIVTALKEELQPFLKRLKIAVPRKPLGEGGLYMADGLHLLQAGLGPRLSARTLALYLEKYRPDGLLNVGLAGALQPDTQTDQIYRVSEIVSGLAPTTISLPVREEFVSLPSARLITVEEAVTDRKRRDELVKRYDAQLVDMEAYALAETARWHNTEFFSLKIVSDLADEDAVETVLNKYKILCDKMAEHTLQILEIRK